MPKPTPLFLTVAILMSSCASKTVYQPVPVVANYRDRPLSQLTSAEVVEADSLMRRTDLTKFEKRRLWELTNNELKGLKSGSPRFQEKQALSESLAAELTEFDSELKEVKEQIVKWKDPLATPEERPGGVFRNVKLRREFTQVLSIWNKDRLDEAMKRVQKVIGDSKLMADATDDEWIKINTLKFRLAIELNESAAAASAYETMKSKGKCNADTAQSGFLLSIHYLAKGEPAKGLETLEAQCDPDSSPFNRIKRLYWKSRLRAASGVPRAEAFKELLETRVPGYYIFLAKAWLKERLEFPLNAFGQPSALTTPVALPQPVVELIDKARARLDAGLKKEAAVFIVRASQLLRDKPNRESMDGLVYCAHLLQASAQPLEAMRLYAFVSQEIQEEAPTYKGMPLDFLGEMFPRPFATEIENKCQEWGLDPDYVFALMRQESAFNAGAISSADARGVLQILPSVARQIAKQHRYPYFQDRSLFHVEENLKMALTHLTVLQTRVTHPFFIAASYNAGYERFSRWWRRYGTYPLDAFVEMIPVNETKNYIKLVTRNYLHYRAQRNGGWVEPDLFPLEDFHAGTVAQTRR